MKIVKRILYGIMALFALLCGVIFLCAVKPELSGQIADTLRVKDWQDGGAQTVSGVVSSSGQEDGVNTSDRYFQDLVMEESGNEDTGRDYETRPGDVVWNPDENSNTGNGNSGNTDNKVDPSAYGISVPAAVAGKNGYEPVSGENSEIDDEEAQYLQSELSTGRTGDGLRFDSRFYPYYSMLNDKEQHLYRQIYANATTLVERFAPVENVSVSELKDVFAAVYNDHPELFWLDTVYACKYRKNGQCAEIDLQFNYTADNLDKEKTTFEEKANDIISAAKEKENNYEKEKYVHDTLISKVEYAANAKINQSAYSALVNGRTVCAGYARAFQYILQKLNIPCYYCTGYAGESHAWNIVMLDDSYYNVDTTWDDTGKGTYDYFNKTDADYLGNHLRQDLSRYLPECNGTAYRNLENASDKDKNQDTDNKEDEKDSGDNRRSLADVGMTKESSLTSLEEYYNNCYQNMLAKGRGNYSFSNVVAGRSVFEDVYGAYQTEDYRQGYVDSALSMIDATVYRINWQIESLKDDYYLVTHEVSVQ